MSETRLCRLLYRSEAAIPGSRQAIEAVVEGIVRSSGEANAAAGITGALVFASGTFIQALEGPVRSVEATFERICCDLRHRQLQLLAVATADSRVFADWAMVRSRPGVDLVRLYPATASEPQLQQASAAEAIRIMRIALLRGGAAGARPLASSPAYSMPC
jgi:hypothetical protein